jgi:hypothetical protein
MRLLRPAPLGAALILTWLCFSGCELPPLSGAGPAAQEVMARSGDVPSDLRRCPSSGPIDGYLEALKAKNPVAYRSLQGGWADLKGKGAKTGGIAVFTAVSAGCQAPLGASPGRNLANLVAVFNDEKAAASAYRSGIFGFPTPASDEQLQGLSKGLATGLSDNAWVVQRVVGGRALYVGWWQDQAVVSFLVSADLDSTESVRASGAVERRIR